MQISVFVVPDISYLQVPPDYSPNILSKIHQLTIDTTTIYILYYETSE